MVLDMYLLPTTYCIFVILLVQNVQCTLYNVHTYGTWQVFCIENWNTVQYVQHFLFFILGETWNLDPLVTCGIPYANTYGISGNSAEFRAFLLQKIPRNFAEFRMFYKKFRIPSEVKKALPWTPYLWSLTRFPRVKNEDIFMTPHSQQCGESLTLCIEQYMDHRLTIEGSQS